MVSERGVVIVGTIVGIRGDSRGAGWRTSDYDDATTGVVTIMHDFRTKMEWKITERIYAGS